MSNIVNNELILTRAESLNLLEALAHPNVEALEKRNNMFNSNCPVHAEIREDNTIVLDLPEFSMPIASKKICSTEKITTKEIFFKTTIKPLMDIRYSNHLNFLDVISISATEQYCCQVTEEKSYHSLIPDDFAA